MLEKILNRLRENGWMVVCHNDYHQSGAFMTYWSFSRGNDYVKGEGATDQLALEECERCIDKMGELEPAAGVLVLPLPASHVGKIARVLKALSNPNGDHVDAGVLVRIKRQWPSFWDKEPLPPKTFDIQWGHPNGGGGEISRVRVEDLELIGYAP